MAAAAGFTGVPSLFGVYRQILRSIDNMCTKPLGNVEWRNNMLEQLRAQAAAVTPGDREAARIAQLNAQDLLIMLQATRAYRELLFTYQSDPLSQSERIALSARRVGLNLPNLEDKAAFSTALDAATMAPSSSAKSQASDSGNMSDVVQGAAAKFFASSKVQAASQIPTSTSAADIATASDQLSTPRRR
ncbi:hypothetical protein CAOG_05984 [Capsaspora owczarzaki ATCC 30864]|nr:hypothetical protein CAOG_05984 [Capsaspora owczarzaki ATCC 30864]|eukprot:XP_004345574.1 hypothetical protein CAOG_05984 [Capsaspora owczarzaki ATCC 30864]